MGARVTPSGLGTDRRNPRSGVPAVGWSARVGARTSHLALS